MTYAADLESIRAAAERIAPHAHRTPVITCGALDERSGRALHLKCENLQKVGAFKYRGACNAVMSLNDEEAARGVVTHSSGNHAQALALAARTRGIPATIVMPGDAPAVKRRAVEGYGATVIECDPSQEARESEARRVIETTGATFVSPYDDPRVIAGQGTAFLELVDQAPDLDAVVVPVGGGGMMSGVAIAARALRPGIRIIGVEPELADDAIESVRTGRIVPQRPPRTIADGLRTSLGELTFPVIRDLVDEIVAVSETAIIEATKFTWERAKTLVEPSGAVGIAALLDGPLRSRAGEDGLERIGIIVTGGNIDLDRLPWCSGPCRG